MGILDVFRYRQYPEEVRDALSFLDKNFNYVLRLGWIAPKLVNAASHQDAGEAIREFRQLRRWENWEQLSASVGRLCSKLERAMPLLDASSRRQLQNRMQELRSLKAMVLMESAEKLKPLLLNVDKDAIDWEKVHALAKTIQEHLAAIIAVEQTLKSMVTERSSTAQQPALAR